MEIFNFGLAVIKLLYTVRYEFEFE